MKNISIKAMIPNMLTAGNLWLGVLAIISALDGDFKKACIYVIVAAFLDGLDGKAARKLNVSSEFGKELDSLCDMVSFGAAPGILAYTIFLNELGTAGLIISILFITAGAFRLARFNVLNITTHFIGVPITIAGGFLALVMLMGSSLSPLIIAALTLVLSYLMVSNIKTPKF